VARKVDAIEIGPAERVDAVVMVNRPGVEILGEADDQARNAGRGGCAKNGGEPQLTT
jgi:hypothetical protein